MDHSLGHRYYDRSYVGLGFFFLKGNPLFYEGIVLWLCIVREYRGCCSGCDVGFGPSICWME